MTHVATINAFPNKFGSYTGAIRNELTREVMRQRFETYENWRFPMNDEAWRVVKQKGARRL